MDNYKIISLLGQGGFGSVYKVKKDNIEYAIKKIIDVTENEKDKILKEYNIITELNKIDNNPIIKYFEKFEENSDRLYIYFVMELAKSDLRHYLVENDIDIEKKNKIANEIIDCIKFIHNNGIVHGDLKPENILVMNDNKLKLSDFGLSCLVEPLIMNPNPYICDYGAGTITHMDPEILFTNKKICKSSDIYSLGVILFELYTNNIYFNKFDFNTPENIVKYYTKIYNNYKDKIPKVIFEMLKPFGDRISIEEVNLKENYEINKIEIPILKINDTNQVKDIVRNAIKDAIRIAISLSCSIKSNNVKQEIKYCDKFDIQSVSNIVKELMKDEYSKLLEEVKRERD